MAIHAHSTTVPGFPLLRRGDQPARLLSTEELLAFLGTRENAERVVEALIQALDELDGDPDLEPSLGAQECTIGFVRTPFAMATPVGDQTPWSHGGTLDLEEVDEDGGDINDEPQDDHELDDDFSDSEPSLGSLDGQMGQGHWSGGRGEDLEDDGARVPRLERVPCPEPAGIVARRAGRQLQALQDRGFQGGRHV